MLRRIYINKLSKFQKITCLILILGFILAIFIGIPTLARYKNRSTIVTASLWDGSVASSYKEGTGLVDDPYIISNGSELAYFQAQLVENDYQDTYFVLSNDILLNDGIFAYDSTNGIQYILNDQVYYVEPYSNKYYDNVDRIGTEVGTINTFNSLEGLKGHFDGCSYRIYGLYITNEIDEELALFTNLQGDLTNLYVENSIIYGGLYTGGIASTTNNASLNNILFDGHVIGKNTELIKTINTNPTAPIINVENTETTNYIDLTNSIPFVGSEITSTSITGNYVINGATDLETTVKINGNAVTNGSFNIDLGTSILDSVDVLTSTTSTEEVTLTFSNLSYNITYNYGASGGIVAASNNTTIKNTVNKASVYGYSTSGGLVGVTTNSLSINQSYNAGDIDSNYVSGGLIGTIEKSNDNIIVSKSYNRGNMYAPNIGGLIGIVNNNIGTISTSYVFNTSTTDYSIGTINNTVVNVTDAYYVNGVTAVNNGVINGSFTLTTMSNLETKSYVATNLLFNEFVDFDDLILNDDNVWVYEEESLPILFIDDLNNPIANIHVNVYSWDNLSVELSSVKLNSNITFSIEPTDDLRPLKETYYYISNSTEPLTQTEIDGISSWSPYTDIVQISEEGFYVIYTKVVDYNDNVTYMNTDLLVLDLSPSTASVSVDDNIWSDLRSSLNNVYIDREKYVTVEATDSLSGISSIKYYITDQILTTTDLDQLSDSSWNMYTDEILVNQIGTHILYVQVIDNCDHTTYINTDYIILDGYTETGLIIGRNSSSYLEADPYITDKSTVTLDFSYTNSSSSPLSGHTHNLISNILLPLGTKMTLIDNITDKVHEYEITTTDDIYNYNNSCDIGDLDCIKVATYPLTLFKEIGTGTIDKAFTESDYYDNGTIDENFTVVLDLSSTNIGSNYDNVILYMELHDSNGVNVRPTLYNTIEDFNIYSIVNSEATNASLYLTTDYSGGEIIYDSDSSTNININSGLNYKYINGFKITDTTYEDKEIGLSIKLVDSDGGTIDKDYLKSITFKIGTDSYYPEEDNIVRINLESGISDVSKILTISTHENNGTLDEGTYYFKISNYVSNDGEYYDILGDTELSIPVNVLNNKSNITYSFDVIIDSGNCIIDKTNDTVQVSFNILQNGELNNPNIRVSLYKKNELTAYNQDYSIVDLSNFVSDSLNSSGGYTYYVSTNPVEYSEPDYLYNNFMLNLITANFENTGYKYVFELYDGTKKVGSIEKYFIVK